LKFISIAIQVLTLPTSRQAMPRKTVMKVKHNYFSPPRSHRPLITVPPALTGAAITTPAFAEPFIAAGAAVAFIRCSLLFFKGTHGLVVPSRHWFFFAAGKGKAPAAMSGIKL
jgi:hypothetical protein